MIELAKHAFMITGFVFTMMLLIEYLNVFTKGRRLTKLTESKWGRYVFAAFLGATPGCLGAFAVVAMYSHRLLTPGAVVAAMIATSGDESFVMFAMIPKKAMILTAVLFALGVVAGALTDVFAGKRIERWLKFRGEFEIHTEESCVCFSKGEILKQWKNCSAARGILAFVLIVFMAGLVLGSVGPPEWNWIRVTLLLVTGISLFIVSTTPDHFLEEHLWRHVAMKHAPQVFLWTFGALLAAHVLTKHLDLGNAIQENQWIVLLMACLVGLIPESGPHLIFLTFYAKGIVPAGVLLASSIVQDGHGMLPLLAHSRRAFIGIKLINLFVGLLVGAVVLAMGF